MTWSNPPGGAWPGKLRRLATAPDLPLTAAATLATAALLQSTASMSRGSFAGGASTPEATALVLGLGSTVPLAFARTQLTAAAVAVTACVLLAPLSGTVPAAAGLVALAVLLHLVGLRSRPPVALLFALPFVAYAVGPAPDRIGGKPLGAGLLAAAAAALALGVGRRARRETAARTAADWAYADTLLQHAVRGERARIARELHDIVAHHISSLSVQAETARLTTPGLPPEGAERLLAIGETARLALTEMRSLLGVLREDMEVGGPQAAGEVRRSGAGSTHGAGPRTGAQPVDRTPQPGLDQLLALVDRARKDAGAVVRLTVSGRVRPLGPGVELAAYRIVQEALTNARRHAPGAAVDVELTYGEDALRIAVRNSSGGGRGGERDAGERAGGVRMRGARPGGLGWGRRALAGTGVGALLRLGGNGTGPGAVPIGYGPGVPGAGGRGGIPARRPAGAGARGGKGALAGGNGGEHGLLGMRERAAMAGGALSAGPDATTGFLVEARLPIPAGAA